MEKSVHTPEYAALRSELRRMRESAGYSQRDLAGLLDVPPSWVAKVETGERRLDVIEFCRVASACSVDPAVAFGKLLKTHPRLRKAKKGGRQP